MRPFRLCLFLCLLLLGSVHGRAAAKVVTDADRKWWAFQGLNTNVGVASRESASSPRRLRDPIDGYILSQASEKKLSLNKPADKRTLIRRAYFDLLGLPPTPEEIAAFVKDGSKDAWPRLIDRLLASPHYGERWARHWLDVARFAESSGFEHDYDREGAFYYRDFVIKALNRDMSYDQFIRWQLAGDEFEPSNALAMSATGFLGAGVFPTQITANEVERTRYDALDDMLATTSVAFIGLTVGCARCHDHKYDPIPTRDYYRMLSTFTTTVRSEVDLDMDPAKTKAAYLKWEKEHESLKSDLKSYEAGMQPAFDAFLASPSKSATTHAWSLLEVTKMISKAGATFSKRDDGSYLAEGENGDDDVYTIAGTSALKRMTAVRVEALSDLSMPHGGPGRAENGNFALSKVQVFVVSSNDEAARAKRRALSDREVKIVKAAADFEQNGSNLSVGSSIDEDAKTGWAVDPQFGKDHSAMFTFAEPVELTNGASIRVVLEFHVNKKHNIGRPRVSITDDGRPSLDAPVTSERVAEILSRAADAGGVRLLTSAATGDERTAVFDWWKRQQGGWREVYAKVEEHLRAEPNGKTKVLICGEGYTPVRMNTQGADFFEQTYYLKRGNADMKDGVACQGFLQVVSRPVAQTSKSAVSQVSKPATSGASSTADLEIGDTAGLETCATNVERWKFAPPKGAKFSGRRATLANWITDTNGGAGILAARVMVNRLWQHHFGRAIVETPNDFGHAGALPTHPELLDYLASELIRNGWKLKPIHKLIMTSATYMQSSAPDAKKEAADPENKYFCRRTPRRLEGEAIRDCMLAVSGALDTTMFGPGTKDEHSKRRSIYFTIKRSQLVGSMVAFDCPEPLVSQGTRPTTTVAPQALMILNGPQVREWAEALAKKVSSESDSESAKTVTRAYQIALGRKPTSVEAKDAGAFLKAQMNSYRAEEKTAKNASALALTDFCQVLFGLNEFVYEN